ncbi:hypothetical protein FRC15_003231 [Serendipita sp. 397]|nr:hypothetical protein FRC15_003231 [Serendipita sp. 397]
MDGINMQDNHFLVALRDIADGPNPDQGHAADSFGGLDLFGQANGKQILWNSRSNAFGLVCSPSIDVNNAIVSRIVASHIHVAQGRVLMLHVAKALSKGCSVPLPTTNSSSSLVISYVAPLASGT